MWGKLSRFPLGCEIVVLRQLQAVADPGFPVGGRRPVGGGGRQPPTHTLFSENVCENERN